MTIMDNKQHRELVVDYAGTVLMELIHAEVSRMDRDSATFTLQCGPVQNLTLNETYTQVKRFTIRQTELDDVLSAFYKEGQSIETIYDDILEDRPRWALVPEVKGGVNTLVVMTNTIASTEVIFMSFMALRRSPVKECKSQPMPDCTILHVEGGRTTKEVQWKNGESTEIDKLWRSKNE